MEASQFAKHSVCGETFEAAASGLDGRIQSLQQQLALCGERPPDALTAACPWRSDSDGDSDGYGEEQAEESDDEKAVNWKRADPEHDEYVL